MSFKKDFVWGASTAAYQIEGAAYEADKGLNVWDVCSATGQIFEGHTGDVGCDHYHRFREDVAIMKQIGLNAYRFSISWSRLMPEGTGKISEDGKRFYLELLEELKKAGITPWVTLFHWDYPHALYLKGGWLNSESPKWFEEYAGVCAELFGDYVDHFIIINEPQCFCSDGHAPYIKLPVPEVLRCAHNVLLACGLAEKKIRAVCSRPVKIGIAQAFTPFLPYTKADEEAAKEETFSSRRHFGGVNFWSDPVIFGRYPENFRQWFDENKFSPSESDMKIIKSKMDFYAVNTYFGVYVTQKDGRVEEVVPSPDVPKTDMRWNVCPDSMYYGAKYVYERYGVPVVYTENGVALTEWKDLNGEINDDSRIDYIKRYLRALHAAAQEIPVEGYFYWSLMDNFEWREGFSKKFGLVHIDYKTGERTLKKSAYWYKKLIESNGEEIFK